MNELVDRIFGKTPLTTQEAWNAHLITQPRRTLLFMGGILGLSILCNVYLVYTVSDLSRGIKHIPMVAIVDETGRPAPLGIPQELTKPTEVHKKALLSDFIRKAREISDDEIVVASWVKSARAHLIKGKSDNKYVNWVQTSPQGTMQRIGKVTVQVSVKSITSIPDTNSYEIRWKETIFGKDRRIKDQYHMVGVFSLVTIPLERLNFSQEQKLKKFHENPLGIYIKDFNWSREL